MNKNREPNSSLAIVDLDGVVFNSTERFKKAEKPEGGTDWSIAFNTDLLQLDTLIEGADEAIHQLEMHDYDVIYLTSRPESMYKATWARLTELHLSGPEMVCKPDEKKYTKTVKWKADEVQEWAGKYKNVVFIDDEAANRQAVEELGLPNVVCKESLAETVRYERFVMYDRMSEEYSEIALYPHLPCSMCLTTTPHGVIQYKYHEWNVIARCSNCQDKLDEQIEIQQAELRAAKVREMGGLPSEDAAIIAQSVDPAVMTSWENEIVDPSPRRPRDDGGPAIIV